MDEDIKLLLEKNLAMAKKNMELTEEIFRMTKKIKGYVNFQKVMSFIYFLLIVVPLVLGAIYLPPLLSNLMSQYQDLLGGGTGAQFNFNDLLKGGAGGIKLNGADVLEKLKNIPAK